MNCQAKVTLDYGDGPHDCPCALQTDHEGSHKAIYNPLPDGVALELSWYDLPAPSPCPAPGKRQRRDSPATQEPFRSKNYPVKKD